MESFSATAVAILRQFDEQCRTWANQHAASCALLASLLNITRQREYTQKQLTDHSTSSTSVSHHASANIGQNALPFGPRTLELLIHKQSLEIEAAVQQLFSILKVLQQIVDQMNSLEQQAEALVRRYHQLNTGATAVGAKTTPSITSTQNERDALCATADITPLQALEWTQHLRDCYNAEYQVKRAQLTQDALSQALERFETLDQLSRNWSLQRRLDFGLEQEIKERLDTFKRIHDYANLTTK